MPIVRAGSRYYVGLDFLILADATDPASLVVTMARGDPIELQGREAASFLAQLDAVALPEPGQAPMPARVVRAHRVPLPPAPDEPEPPVEPEPGLGESV